MKLFSSSLLLPLLLPFSAAFAAEPLVTCHLQNFKSCMDCGKRIPAACEDNSMTGSLEMSLKPAKLQWRVSDAQRGTEKLVMTDNKTLTLKDLKNAKDLKALAQKQKVSVQAGEVVSLASVEVAPGTALYKKQTGTEIAAKMKPENPKRAIASSTAEAQAGGVARAQNQNQGK